MRTTLISAAVLLASVAPARALTIVQTQGFVGHPNILTTVEFDRFDPSKGELQSIEWIFDLNIEGGSLTVDNDGPLPATVNVELGATGSLLSTDVRLLDGSSSPILSGASAVGVSTGSSFELEGDNGDGMTFDPTLPDADTHFGGTASVSSGAFVSTDVFGDYVGTTLFDIRVDIDQLLSFGGVGGISGQFDPVLASPNITLIYEYVPEPGSIVSALIGIIGVVGLVRRRVR